MHSQFLGQSCPFNYSSQPKIMMKLRPYKSTIYTNKPCKEGCWGLDTKQYYFGFFALMSTVTPVTWSTKLSITKLCLPLLMKTNLVFLCAITTDLLRGKYRFWWSSSSIGWPLDALKGRWTMERGRSLNQSIILCYVQGGHRLTST